MRADAEAKTRELMDDNIAINEKIVAKDTDLAEARQQTLLNTKKIAVQEQKRIDAKRREESLLEKKEELRNNLDAMRKEMERLEYEEKELRGHIENAKMLRLYLNKNLEGNIKSPKNFARSRVNNDDNFWN